MKPAIVELRTISHFNPPLPPPLQSSYYWYNNSFGVPDGKSDCKLCTSTCDGCETVPYMAAYNAKSAGYDGPQGYTRAHRDSAIVAAMRGWIHLSNTTEALEPHAHQPPVM